VSDWTFGGTWPYEPRFFQTPDGRMHYVDEGPRDGRPVVLLHGNPTWGYLYRAIIPELVAAGHRAIAVDHLGFGRSDVPDDPEPYRVSRHVERLEALLDSLDLNGATMVPHDWGGPIGLPWAVKHAERVEGLFILNTFAPRLPGPMGERGTLRLLRAPGIGALGVKGRDGLTETFLFKSGLAHPERLDDDAKAAYRAAHPSWRSRTPLLAFPRQIPLRPGGEVADLTSATEEGLRRDLRGKPAALCWGMRDILFGEEVVRRWLETLPDAEVIRLDDAGHFLQEDAPEEVARRLVAFLERA
jgi:pimeloyl-ACP methyl ester carboxylesterase